MKRTVYQGKFIRVDEEETGPSRAIYEKAYLKNAVTVIPFTSEGKVIFIRENRPHEDPPIRIKLVTGFIEDGLGVEENANKELQEEVGFKAGQLRIYAVNRMTGSVNQTNHFVLAGNLVESRIPNPDGEESILEVIPMRISEVYAMLMEGRYSPTSAAYILLKICIEIREGRFDFAPEAAF
jgi:ADP-ribose pyrophosphatase YjhB (NUDIX family)